jgi:hypothetical protein
MYSVLLMDVAFTDSGAKKNEGGAESQYVLAALRKGSKGVFLNLVERSGL